ncbi:MAG: hypothetical protein ACJ8AK_06660 [Gemmatimonadaceae bacterium]
MRRATIVALAFVSAASFTQAQDAAHPHTTSPERLGTVHFATSCKPDVTPQFDRAVALLHSFEFGASIRGFNDVLAADSTCVMAYWGLALSRWGNPTAAGNRPASLLQQGGQWAFTGARLAAAATDRERGYLGAVSQLYDDFQQRDQHTRVEAYSHAMESLVMQQPADTEAKIFYAISLVAAASPTDKTYGNQLKAGAILEALWAKQPDHPGLAHYIIHTYDYPALADKARAAAARYALIAPSAAHALHMPSHTFTRLGMWKESVDANERSSEAALNTGSIAEALHAADYEMYAYLQLGEYGKAKSILEQLPTIAARFDPNAIGGAAPPAAAYFAMAAIPARWALERGAWAEAAALEPKTTDYPYADAITHFARAIGASRTRDFLKAQRSIDSLAAIQQRLTAQKESYWAEQVAIQLLGAQAWLALAEGKKGDALKLMREAATREDATEKSAVTPGPVAPAHELLGDMLMQMGRPAQARAEFQLTLKKEPNRRHSLVQLAPATASRLAPPASH